jgi:hypothetical protein
MEIKRTPYRVILLTKNNCADLEDAIITLTKLVDEKAGAMVGLSGPTPTAYAHELRKSRNSLAILRTAVVDIDF